MLRTSTGGSLPVVASRGNAGVDRTGPTLIAGACCDNRDRPGGTALDIGAGRAGGAKFDPAVHRGGPVGIPQRGACTHLSLPPADLRHGPRSARRCISEQLARRTSSEPPHQLDRRRQLVVRASVRLPYEEHRPYEQPYEEAQ